MTNGFRGLLVGGGEPIYVKLKEVKKLAVNHFKFSFFKQIFFLKDTVLTYIQPEIGLTTA